MQRPTKKGQSVMGWKQVNGCVPTYMGYYNGVQDMQTGDRVLVIEFANGVLGIAPGQILDPIRADELATQVDNWVNGNIDKIADIAAATDDLRASIKSTQWRCIGRDSFSHEPTEGEHQVRFVLIPQEKAQLHPNVRRIASKNLIIGSHKITWYNEENTPSNRYIHMHLEGRPKPDQTSILQWCRNALNTDNCLLNIENCAQFGKGEGVIWDGNTWGITVSIEDRKWSLDDERTVVVVDIKRHNNLHHPGTVTHQAHFSSPISEAQWEDYLEHRAQWFGYHPAGYGMVTAHCGQVSDDGTIWQYSCWGNCD